MTIEPKETFMFERNQPALRRQAGMVLAAVVAFGLALSLVRSAHAQADNNGAASGASVNQVQAPAIIGGREAVPGAWPWQVGVINHFNESSYEGQYCGGSLIAPNWALTAAHCIDGKDASVIDVLVGAHRLSESGLRVQGDLVIVHPGYDPATLDSDLALVRLSTSVTQTPIALYAPVAGADELRFMRATVTGWGINDSGSFPDALREVALPLVDRKTCADAFLTPVTENMICAGYRPLTKTACYGDSGGPLMVQNEGGQWLQIGIVSWGPATCISDSGYDVYTRVGNYQAWIQACIDDPDTLQCNGADLFEPDDSAPAAQPYTTWGEAQVHTFHVRGDQDWLTFDVVEGRTYVINTEHEITAASTVNTVVWLYGADGHTPITFSDGRGLVMSTHAAAGAYAWGTPDPGFGPEVKSDVTILWTADRTGTVYAGVENLALSDDPNATGPYARYRITGAEYAATAYFPLLVTPAPGGAPAASAAKARY